jgi:hypothetical protein
MNESVTIAQWRRKPNRPRYYVTNGRQPVGTIFESKGVFTAIDPNGKLVTASTSVRIAANTLTARASS